MVIGYRLAFLRILPNDRNKPPETLLMLRGYPNVGQSCTQPNGRVQEQEAHTRYVNEIVSISQLKYLVHTCDDK